VKSAVGEINPEILIQFQSFKAQIESSLLRERLMATLSGFFGLLAVLLACIGLYGVMSYGVAGRTKEIGIRMALGADRPKLLWLILREGLAMVLIGMALGLPAVIAATDLVSSLLFGLPSTDPISISVAALLMLLVGTAAGYIPARRATRVDPLISLRYE
jgi:ABC-type antimicrobial peptide transport system permease subunit